MNKGIIQVEDKFYKKCKVVMLSTEKVSDLFVWEGKLQFSKFPQKVNCQHLYILSDEEIKEGDWYYNTVS